MNETALTPAPTMDPPRQFSHDEWHTLCSLQVRYQLDRDLFSAGEREQLLFLRWLYQHKRLVA